ncbi:hypothetical protein COS86_06385 [Candidatus Bathyarchaeota archaeon CG07_land_8_20_14_0_80_47_9]|nr:MAG: hypothetical protein COS86_06385 [Candidatus Bathyarchaeota archaeon CG07_land_8_20_14_0_80_47_9]
MSAKKGWNIISRGYQEKTGISLKKVLELEPYRIDRMSVSEREKLPYLHEYYVKHYDLLKRIPYTLIFKARRPMD